MKTKIRELPSFEINEISSKKTKYCLCIPIINEGERILKELERAKKSGVNKIVDIIICDGGSKDGSTEIKKLEKLGVNTLLVKTGPGKQGAQLRMGMSWALDRGYEGIITIDGNNKDSIEDVFKFVEKLDEGYDFIQGSRYAPGGFAENTPLSRSLAVKLIHAPIISLTAGKKYTDTTSAYRGYSKKYLLHDDVNIFRDVFKEYELLAYLSVKADQLNLKTCEVGVSRIYPKGEKTPTKISPIKGNSKLLKTLFLNMFGRYEEKPKVNKNILFLFYFLTIFVCILVFRLYAYSKMIPYTMTADSYSYDAPKFFDFFIKGPDPLRVPIYPFILNILNLITPNYFVLMVKIQIIISFISLFYLYKIIGKLSNKHISIILTFLYGISISLFSFDNLILTESLSLSFFIILIYYIIRFVELKRTNDIIFVTILSIFLVFLKPTFALIPLIIWGYNFLSFLFKKNIHMLKNLLISLIPVFLIFTYIIYFNYTHGVKTLSLTSVNQKFIISLQRGYYNNYSDKIISPIIYENSNYLQNKDYWSVTNAVHLSGISWKQINEYNKKVFEKNKNKVYDDSIKTLIEQKYGFIYQYSTIKSNMINSRFMEISLFLLPMISVFNIFIISIFYLLVVFVKSILNKKIASIDLFLYLMLTYPFITAILLTNSEYPRTSIASYPIFYIIIGVIIHYLGNQTLKLRLKNEFLGEDESNEL